jgi:hypothetical protein
VPEAPTTESLRQVNTSQEEEEEKFTDDATTKVIPTVTGLRTVDAEEDRFNKLPHIVRTLYEPVM